jgi:hypothetical protein
MARTQGPADAHLDERRLSMSVACYLGGFLAGIAGI